MSRAFHRRLGPMKRFWKHVWHCAQSVTIFMQVCAGYAVVSQWQGQQKSCPIALQLAKDGDLCDCAFNYSF